MKLQINRVKPFLYIIIALAGMYLLFTMRQQATAQTDRQRENRGQQENRQTRRNQQRTETPTARTIETENRQEEARSSENRQQESNTAADTAQPQTPNTGQTTGDNFRQRYDAAGTTERDRLNQQSSNFGFFQITFILLILCVIGYFIYKYVSKRKSLQMEAADYINVLATSPLAANKHLQVVQIFDNIYILGVGDNSINLIKEVTDKNLISQIREEAKNRLPSLTFKEQIVKLLNKVKPGATIKKDPEEEALSFFKEQREKLNHLNGNNKDT